MHSVAKARVVCHAPPPVLRTVSAWCAVVLCASDAGAFTLRVLAPTDLRVAPSVSADRSAVSFVVSMRDDQGTPISGAVRLDARRARGSIQQSVALRSDGQGSLTVPVSRDDRAVDVRAQFAGDTTHAAATVELRVDLDAPFVTVQLQSVPAAVNVESQAPVEWIASVEVGRVALTSPLGWPVQFYLDNNPVGSSRADATGRASVRVEAQRFSTPGVHTVRAAAQLRGTELWSAERRLIVRALTSVVVTPERDDRSGQLTLRGAVAWRGGGVAGATVRVESQQTLVAAALTDAQGSYELTIPPRALIAGARARVVFVPTTPWLSGAESAEFYLAPPAVPPVSWRYALAPLALGMLTFALLRLRSRPRASAAQSEVVQDGAVLEALDASDDSPTLVVVVDDRASGERIESCTVTVDGVPAEPGQGVAVTVGASVKIVVEAQGYARRSLTVQVRRAGAQRLRVSLARWREAVFAVAREAMDAPIAPKAAPTLQEAAANAPPAKKPLFTAAESAVYGPEEPGERALEQVRKLAEEPTHRER